MCERANLRSQLQRTIALKECRCDFQRIFDAGFIFDHIFVARRGYDRYRYRIRYDSGQQSYRICLIALRKDYDTLSIRQDGL